MTLDKTDKYILKLLQDNSQVTVKEISIQTGLSTTPVFERIKRLEKNGFIKKYVAILDREKIDKGLMPFCSIVLKDHSKEAFKRFETDIARLPEIVECFKIAGSTDYLLKIIVKNMKEYNEFTSTKLGQLDAVGRRESSFVMGEVKNTTEISLA